MDVKWNFDIRRIIIDFESIEEMNVMRNKLEGWADETSSTEKLEINHSLSKKFQFGENIFEYDDSGQECVGNTQGHLWFNKTNKCINCGKKRQSLSKTKKP